MTERPHLAVALDGAGWHPAAWREPDARPDELFSARYWVDLVREAQSAAIDFVTFEDSLALQRGGSPEAVDRVRGRLDAVLTAARVAPLTSGIGLVPTVVTTHTEPFHIAKAIATLDYVSTGRAGVRLRVGRPHEYPHFGRRDPGEDRDVLFADAAEYAEVVRGLWDSWEDDAEIRDAATGRFIDRDKLHYIDFRGEHLSVKGPSITPRPPQGQPPVTALAHVEGPFAFAEAVADLAYVTPTDRADAERIATRLAALPHVFGDLVVFLDQAPGAAAARLARLDETAGKVYASDAHVFTGTAAELADLLLDWHAAGLSGFRLRPGALPHDLTAITRALVPELRARGAFRDGYTADTLRGQLGLPRPANRYAA
ncbi:LLM class flavin-dependent oxidoreductase [Actinokineospora sp. G85]|uniref:LLM class flavin-dependent oxidoreductase n=1 Tax=Actinokineospora sp. G85 TaxID=3406626 RepID=UPI003C730CAE